MELRILEYLAGFLLFLSIVRPFIRGLWKLPGLTVFPFLALAIIAGIFPAYGFRPECIPLLLFAIFLVIANLADFLALFIGLQSESYRDRGLLFTLCSAAAFAFTVWIMVYYAPPMDAELKTEGIKTIFLHEGELHVRIYNKIAQTESVIESINRPEGAYTAPERPLLVLLPPAAGSFLVSDDVCSALGDRGFTVLSFSRIHFDSPFFDQNGQPVRLSISGLFRLGNALIRGLRNTSANAGGRELEEVRKQDIAYILNELPVNKTLHNLLANTDKNTIFLAGYGAGGAALTVLAGSDNFIARYPQIRGIISIEAPLLSSLEGDALPDPPPPASDPVSAFYQQIKEYAIGLIPRNITHVSEIPRPGLPVFFILSDRVINEKEGRYLTILRTLRTSRNTAVLAAVPGAGPFDYSGSPRHYPLLSFLFRGAKQPEEQRNWPDVTASLIANFAALILESEAAAGINSGDADGLAAGPEISGETIPFRAPLAKTSMNRTIYLEQGGVWNIPDVRTILDP